MSTQIRCQIQVADHAYISAFSFAINHDYSHQNYALYIYPHKKNYDKEIKNIFPNITFETYGLFQQEPFILLEGKKETMLDCLTTLVPEISFATEELEGIKSFLEETIPPKTQLMAYLICRAQNTFTKEEALNVARQAESLLKGIIYEIAEQFFQLDNLQLAYQFFIQIPHTNSDYINAQFQAAQIAANPQFDYLSNTKKEIAIRGHYQNVDSKKQQVLDTYFLQLKKTEFTQTEKETIVILQSIIDKQQSKITQLEEQLALLQEQLSPTNKPAPQSFFKS